MFNFPNSTKTCIHNIASDIPNKLREKKYFENFGVGGRMAIV